MKYWYKKQIQEISGHGDFIGHREIIYKGKDKPEEFIVRYLAFPFKNNESLQEYHDRFHNIVKVVSSQDHLDEYENGSDISTKKWKINWKKLKEYNEVYYSHNPTDIVEITKEK